MNCLKYYDTIGALHQKKSDIIRFRRTLPHLMTSGSLLDVGCGEGYWLNFLAENTDLKLFGSDISPVKLGAASHRCDENFALSSNDIRKLPYGDGKFDQVTVLEVLEHIPEWQEGLDEIVRVASKRVVITVPYNEKRAYETCHTCESIAYHDGHLHTFNEEAFNEMDIGCDVTYDHLDMPFGFGYYFGRVIDKLFEIKNTQNQDTQKEPFNIVCPNCYEKMPSTKSFQRKLEILRRLIFKEPLYLLVRIDK